jgi:hypothetical protein
VPSGNGRRFTPESLLVTPELTIFGGLSAGRSTIEQGSLLFLAMYGQGGSGAGYSFRLASGALPTGWTLSPTGTIGGRATSTGTYRFTIEVRDSLGNTAQQTREVMVPLTAGIDLMELPTVVRSGAPVAGRIRALPAGSYRYAVVEGALPEGLVLDPQTGEIRGTPTSTGALTVQLVSFSATDSTGRAFRSERVSISVHGPVIFRDPPGITEHTLDGTFTTTLVGRGFIEQTVTAEGLPSFLELTTSGRLSDIGPAIAGTYAVRVNVLDSLGITTSRDYTFVVNANPRIEDIRLATIQGRAARVNPANLANDPDGNLVSLESFTAPTNATVTRNGNELVITPDPAISRGIVEVPFTLADGAFGTVTRKVVLEVFDLNNAPTVRNDSTTTPRNATAVIDVLANDSDFDRDPLYVLSAGSPTHGTVLVRGNRVEYSPRPGFQGFDRFSYVATDGLDPRTGSVAIKVGNPTVFFRTAPSVTFTEGQAASPSLSLGRAGDLSEALDVQFTVAAGATNPARLTGSEADVRSVRLTARFEPGSATAVVNPFTIVDDTRVEARDESLVVRITKASGWDIGAASLVNVRIRDNDGPVLTGAQQIRDGAGAVTGLRLSFNAALDPASLRYGSSIAFLSAGADARLGTADDRLVPLAVSYAPGSRQVELRMTSPLARGDLQELRLQSTIRAFNGVGMKRLFRQFRS